MPWRVLGLRGLDKGARDLGRHARRAGDQRDAHAMRRGFDGQGLGQAAQRELGRAVRAQPSAAPSKPRIDDTLNTCPPRCARAHGGAYHVHGAEDADIETLAQRRVGQLIQRPRAAQAALFTTTSRPPKAACAVDRAPHAAFIAKIHGQRAAAIERRAGRFQQGVHVARGRRHAMALLQQGLDQRQSQSRGGPGHKPDFPDSMLIPSLEPGAGRMAPRHGKNVRKRGARRTAAFLRKPA